MKDAQEAWDRLLVSAWFAKPTAPVISVFLQLDEDHQRRQEDLLRMFFPWDRSRTVEAFIVHCLPKLASLLRKCGPEDMDKIVRALGKSQIDTARDTQKQQQMPRFQDAYRAVTLEQGLSSEHRARSARRAWNVCK